MQVTSLARERHCMVVDGTRKELQFCTLEKAGNRISSGTTLFFTLPVVNEDSIDC